MKMMCVMGYTINLKLKSYVILVNRYTFHIDYDVDVLIWILCHQPFPIGFRVLVFLFEILFYPHYHLQLNQQTFSMDYISVLKQHQLMQWRSYIVLEEKGVEFKVNSKSLISWRGDCSYPYKNIILYCMVRSHSQGESDPPVSPFLIKPSLI